MMPRTPLSTAVLFPLSLTLACTSPSRTFSDVDASAPAGSDGGEPSDSTTAAPVDHDAASTDDLQTVVLTVDLSSGVNDAPDAQVTSNPPATTDYAAPDAGETSRSPATASTSDVSSNTSASDTSASNTGASDVTASDVTSNGETSSVACDGCSIGGDCIAANSPNPDNSCQVCDPAQATDAWVPNDAASCSDGDYCNGEESCYQGSCTAGTAPCGVNTCDEPNDQCCEPTAQLACGGDGNVHLVDTCGSLGGVEQVCSGECRDGGCRCVVYVNSGGSDDNDGTSWAGAKQTIGNAIATATPLGCEVWVRTGTYRPGYLRTHSIQLVSNVDVFGGFSGTETQRDERNFDAYPTIITGDVGYTPGDTSDDANHIVLGADNAILDGFTITAANTEGGGDDCGGGVLNASASPTLRNLKFTENLAPSTGADICNRSASPTIEGCNFTNTRSTSSGGGFGVSLYQQGGSAVIRRSVFIAIDAGRGSGAGIANEGQLLIEDSEFRSLNIRDGGSAIYNNTGASLTIKSTLFMDNSVNSSGSGASDGGAIYSNGTLKIIDSTFANNKGGAGGAIGVSAGSVTIVNSRFVGNSAGIGYGGAITVRAGALNVAGCLFESNTANAYAGYSGSGGAIYMGGGGVNVVSSTFVDNSAAIDLNTDTGGGALYLGANSINSVTNCLFWENTGATADDIQFNATAVLQLSSSTFGAGYPCSPAAGCVSADPGFDPARTAYHDYTPSSTSGCVDTGAGGELPADTFDLDGDNDTAEALPLDLLGHPRVAGTGIDIGAFEQQP